MIIEKYQPYYQRSQSEDLCAQAFRNHRPLLKDKYRNFAPTVLSLLEEVMTAPQSEMEHIQHSTESHCRIHEIPVIKDLESVDSTYGKDAYSFSSCSCVTSHRTEDIEIREDEDGIRTHVCPLGEVEDSENHPDEAMKLDLDAILSGECSLRSEDIQCLLAEGPFMTDSEDKNAGSVIDTSMNRIYTPTCNESLIDQNDAFSFPLDTPSTMSDQNETLVPRSTTQLDEKTMTSWARESSDDTEYCLDEKRETEMLLEEDSDESDMEEFNEASNTANYRYINLESTSSEETCKHPEQNVDTRGQSGSGTDDRVHKESSQESSNNSNTQNINDEKINFTAISGQQLDSAKSTNLTIDSMSVENSSNSVEQSLGTSTDVLKTETTNAPISEVTVAETNKRESHISSDLMYIALGNILSIDNTSDVSSDESTKDHSERVATQNEAIAINERIPEKNKGEIINQHNRLEKSHLPDVQLSLTEDADKEFPVDSLTLPGDVKNSVKYETKGHLEPTATLQLVSQSNEEKSDQSIIQPHKTGDSGKRLSVDPLSSLPADVKDGKKGDLAKLALLENKASRKEDSQTDLATALRFMTEVYHKDDEDLYLDTLNFTQMSEVSKERKKSTRTDDSDDLNTSEFKSPCPSSPFEPAPTEEQRAETRPRNKLSKFLKSFKGRFTKKS